ncbi:MAG: nuclear transport factor 2 family protein [Cyclobacteriaceae bacterium]|jgi:hypothetical protein|nr:nuclear transport factor 2 family protein [Cyclobacteriaceae bacterium]
MMIRPYLLLLVLGCACRPSTDVSPHEFESLLHTLARSWSTQETAAAVACFTPDATYMQPPDEQFYQGHEQLRSYFGALKPGTTLVFHQLWFDEETQTGAGEFTFGNTHTQSGVTGVAVIQLKDGKINAWREYFMAGPLDFATFIRPTGKTWKWHIGNYP